MGYGYHDHDGDICDPGCPMWSRQRDRVELSTIVKKRIGDKALLLLCIRPAGQSGWLYTEPEYVLDHLTEGEAGDEWELKYVLLTPAEVDALPEFCGW